MPTTPLPQDPDLDQLRRQARELQRAARRGDPPAIELITEFHPDGPGRAERPVDLRLADAQLVIARRYGFPSWARLHRHLGVITARSWRPDGPVPERESVADRFLRLACLTYGRDGAADREEATRLLAAHPDLPRTTIAVAAACADVAAVQSLLRADPRLATAKTGPHDWSPLLYQAYARHDPDTPERATVDTARLLLQAGADPNDGRFWHGLPTPFTVLTGVLGHGEHAEPCHPHAIPFARLLLDHGADPNDGQALYNRMFTDSDDHLVLLFEYGLGQESSGPWYRLLGDALESPPVMLRNLLAWAITHDQRERVALLAAHGVDIRSRFTELRGQRHAGHTPAELALINGHREVAELLISLGATVPRLRGVDAFVAAAMVADRAAVADTAADAVLRARRARPGLIVWAAAQGVPDAVNVLVDNGFDVNALGRADLPINQRWQTALHVAAERGDHELATRLLDLGADPTIEDQRHHGTPADWARYFGHADLAILLDAGIGPTGQRRIGPSRPAPS